MKQLEYGDARDRLIAALRAGKYIHLCDAAEDAGVNDFHALRIAHKDPEVSDLYGEVITRRHNRALEEWERQMLRFPATGKPLSCSLISHTMKARYRLSQAQALVARWEIRAGKRLVALRQPSPKVQRLVEKIKRDRAAKKASHSDASAPPAH